jgi:hypothetical protein
MKRILMLVCTAALLLPVSAGPAAAAPNEKASCVAQLIPLMGTPGQYQRETHDPTVGRRISSHLAHFHEDCTNVPG